MRFYLIIPFITIDFTVGGCLAVVLNSTTCDSGCTKRAFTAHEFENDQHAHNLDPFYTTPTNFSSAAAPGMLLSVEVATNMSTYSVPSGLSMSRILYITEDLNGTTLPASAYILWPYSSLQSTGNSNSGHPVVAWAHGTSGMFKACAPSNYRSLQYHFMAPFLLATQGMVVVAPDYAGLGVDSFPSGEKILHPWLAGPAQANDIAHAITAARAAFPGLLKPEGPFVVTGHSQGGGAAWAFAERQADKPLKGYKGAVAIAPPPRVFKQYEAALADPSLPYAFTSLGIPPKLVAAVTAAFPAYNYSGFTAISSDRWHNVVKPLQGCLPMDFRVFQDVPADQLAKTSWHKDATVQRYARMTEIGGKKFKGPMLVLASNTDLVVSLDTIESAVDDTCKLIGDERLKESMEMVTYKGVNHFPLIQASQGLWLDWVKTRFGSGAEPKNGCTRKSVDGLRTEFTFPSITPNFLEVWAPPEDFWKYFL